MSLANYQYDAIMRKYNQIQFKNKRIADDHKREVEAKIPELAALDKKQADIALNYGMRILHGDTNASHNMEKELADIEKQRIDLLMAHGYPKDYLDIKFDCNLCHDTGYTDNTTTCICFKKAAVELLYDQSTKKHLYERENFDTFSLKYYSKEKIDPATGKTMHTQAKDAYKKCKEFVDNFDLAHANLLINGPTGVGKSFLANCIAKALIDSVHSVVHLDATYFFKLLADYQFRSNEENIEESAIYDCDCLIIDDLGAELLNSFIVSSLCQCIERRRLTRRATVFTTNLVPSELKERYEDRTFSRLVSDYTFIHLDGDDIRLIKKKM